MWCRNDLREHITVEQKIPAIAYVHRQMHGYLQTHSEPSMSDQLSKPGPRRGRPKSPPAVARPNRIVTFVTDGEMELLEQAALAEDRSMASLVHRIIKLHFEEQLQMIQQLKNELTEGVTVLVKGSRSMAMECVVEALLTEEAN